MKPTIFLCILAFTFFSTEARNLNFSNARFSKKQAERLIRGLNLFPTHGANIVDHDPSFDSPKLVETEFRFPYISDSTNSSVEDFGHHAGYYKLSHTEGARYICTLFFTERWKININELTLQTIIFFH